MKNSAFGSLVYFTTLKHKTTVTTATLLLVFFIDTGTFKTLVPAYQTPFSTKVEDVQSVHMQA